MGAGCSVSSHLLIEPPEDKKGVQQRDVQDIEHMEVFPHSLGDIPPTLRGRKARGFETLKGSEGFLFQPWMRSRTRS